MEKIAHISADYIENNTSFVELTDVIKESFTAKKSIVPMRHHHDFPNPEVNSDSTLLLMPAWNPNNDAGIKIVTVSPENKQFNLPSIHGIYIYLDAVTGIPKATIDAKSLTAKRTAAASALASSFLSRENSNSLLMIGTGVLSTNLIKAHAAVRPVSKVYVWGRNYEKAQHICNQLKNEDFTCIPVKTIEEKISEVDIISCATLSKTPLVFGKHIQAGQHIDLVGSYKKDMREADNTAISKSSVFVDTFQGGLKESGDIVIPLREGILKETDIKADLFQLCSEHKIRRVLNNEITLFKSVGHAIEDLAAAGYYYKKYSNAW